MHRQSDDGYFEAFWPRAARRVRTKQLAARPQSLEGKRVAFLWDYLFRGDDIFDVVEEELRKRFAGMSFMGWRDVGNIHSSDERQMVAALPARLKAAGVDAVITAVAA
jgi:hypothetical protein